MDYCLGEDGSATMWSGAPDVDIDGDGAFDGVGLDFDGDALRDDALVDLDRDGMADHAVLDAGVDARWFTDDGTGTWGIVVSPVGQRSVGPALRWYSLDGAEEVGGPLVDVDGDGTADDELMDVDGDGLADRAIAADRSSGYVDVDGDGRWDVKLVDSDGDGAADGAAQL